LPKQNWQAEVDEDRQGHQEDDRESEDGKSQADYPVQGGLAEALIDTATTLQRRFLVAAPNHGRMLRYCLRHWITRLLPY
jgi:hypothetical protein